jgi:hypothetical protein
MRSFIIKFIFIFLCVRESIFIFSDDSNELEVYYPRIAMIIDHKICDESTINGTLNYDQNFIDKVNECEQIMDYKVNETHQLVIFKIFNLKNNSLLDRIDFLKYC